MSKEIFKMSNGVEIPSVAFGTWRIPNEKACEAVSEAMKIGYTHIDAAAAYGNEVEVGDGIMKGLEETGLKREDIFVTSKLWNTEQGYESTLKAFDKTLNDLKLDYLDLYLIHWPVALGHEDDWKTMDRETWRAFEKLYKENKIRAIGISNFKQHHVENLLETAEIRPHVNQLEVHLSYNQFETIEYCRNEGMLIEASRPLSSGLVFENQELQAIADKYNKSISQICLRWLIQRNIVAIPKSVTPSRIKENFQLYDFELSAEDMDYLYKFEGCGNSGQDPDITSTI